MLARSELVLFPLVLLYCPLFAGEVFVNLGREDILVHTPDNQSEPAPLLIMLHGYGSTGIEVETVLQLAPIAADFGFVYAYPNGTPDFLNRRFWDATDACCNFVSSPVDDVAYLVSLIDAIGAEVTLDSRRIYIAGHSNGGFMAHRLACERPDLIAAIISVAGATFIDAADCNPSEPVHVLQIHGTQDEVIAYEGGNLGFADYPSAFDTVQSWVINNGCSTLEMPGDPLDISDTLPGLETLVSRWENDCATNGSAELWTIQDGLHTPDVNQNFGPTILQFLLDHAKQTADCPGDFDQNAQLDNADLIQQADSWLSFCECEEDLNSDGVVDLNDLISLVNLFGPCP